TKTYYAKTVSTSKNPQIPTIFSNSNCGSKQDGIYICKNNQCCSMYGYCGTSSKYCGTGCKPNYG
ncbi:hypothetical protein BCR36DRAFT_223464, partial [Piromyces finnis]